MPAEQELWDEAAKLLGEDEEHASIYALALAVEAVERGDRSGDRLRTRSEALRSARAAAPH